MEVTLKMEVEECESDYSGQERIEVADQNAKNDITELSETIKREPLEYDSSATSSDPDQDVKNEVMELPETIQSIGYDAPDISDDIISSCTRVENQGQDERNRAEPCALGDHSMQNISTSELQPSQKRARRELSLGDRIKLIKEHMSVSKPTQKELSNKYGVGASTVSDIIKRKDHYLAQYVQNASGSKKRFRSEFKYDDIDKLTWSWFQQARSKNFILNGTIICSKALEFAKQLGQTDFKASFSWLCLWKSRHSVKSFKASNENVDDNLATVEDFKAHLSSTTKVYSDTVDTDLLNCNETGLSCRAMPDKIINVNPQTCEVSKDCTTVMSTSSLDQDQMEFEYVSISPDRSVKNEWTELPETIKGDPLQCDSFDISDHMSVIPSCARLDNQGNKRSHIAESGEPGDESVHNTDTSGLQPPQKRARRELDLEDRIKVIREHMSSKPTQKQLSNKYNVGVSTVSDIIKRKDHYLAQYQQNARGSKKRFRSKCKYDAIDKLMWSWFQQARNKNFVLNGTIMCSKALEFAKQIGQSDFKASDGWLGSWKARHSVKGFKISDEITDDNLATVEEFKARISSISEGYPDSNIFNCDETALSFRALPDKKLTVKRQTRKCGKLFKDRLTVMFACSQTGEKLIPLVIGKVRQPVCFRSIRTNDLPVTWCSNAKALMTGDLFMNWLAEINKEMRRTNRKILMFLDNATSHHIEKELSHIRLAFVPANTTSILQPLEQGIIRTFKAKYRHLLNMHLLTKMNPTDSVSSLVKTVTVFDAVNWIHTAWKGTTVSTIKYYFGRCGFGEQAKLSTPDDEDHSTLASLMKRLTATTLTPEEYIAIDNKLPTEDDGVAWEENILQQHWKKMPSTQTIESDSNEEIDTEPSPSL